MQSDFSNLKNVIHTQDSLEKLKVFGDLVENMTKYIVESKDKSSEIFYLSESIKKQKILFDLAEKLYEFVRVENENNENVEEMIDKLKNNFDEYKNFVEETGKNN